MKKIIIPVNNTLTVDPKLYYLEKDLYKDKRFYTLIIQQETPFIIVEDLFDFTNVDNLVLNIDIDNIHSVIAYTDSKSVRNLDKRNEVLDKLKEN